MAKRIAVDIANTKQVCTTIMNHVLAGERIAFLVGPSQGLHVVARIRVMLSRTRKEAARQGKRLKKFTLRMTVHPETHAGIRYDCIVCWTEVNLTHSLLETAEGLLADG